jgi:hypothetical protein
MLSVLKLRVFGILLGVAQAFLFWIVVIPRPWVQDLSFRLFFLLELWGGIVLSWYLTNAMSHFPFPVGNYRWLKFFLYSVGFGLLIYGTQSLLIRFFNIPILMIPGIAESGVFFMTRSTIKPLFQDDLAAVKRNYFWTIFGCVICAGFACLYALPSYFQISSTIREVQERFQLRETKCDEFFRPNGRCFSYPSGLGDRISAYEMRDEIEQNLAINSNFDFVSWDSSSREYRRYYTPLWKLEVDMVQTPTLFGKYSPEAIGYIRFDLSKR